MSFIAVNDSIDTAEPSFIAANARQRLAASRSRLVKHMLGNAGSMSNLSVSSERERDIDDREPERLTVPSGTWRVIKLGLNRWWRHHPANVALALATPLLHRYADRKPFKLLAISAGVGAVVVFSKPWRLISIGGFAVATLKSSEFSALVASLLTSKDDASPSADSADPHA